MVEQPLQGMEVQEKEAQKTYSIRFELLASLNFTLNLEDLLC